MKSQPPNPFTAALKSNTLHRFRSAHAGAFTSFILLACGTAHAVDISATGANQPSPSTVTWNSATWTGGQWAGGLAPSAGNTYTTAGVQIRTNTGSTTFLGDSLRVASGGSFVLNLSSTNTATIGSLILDGGTLISGGTGTASTQNISGNIDVNANSTIELNGATGNHRIALTSGGLSGNGKITIQGGTDANDYFFVNTASPSTHTGNWDINAGRLIVTADDQIGNSARVTLGSASLATFEFRGGNQTIGSLSGNGTVTTNTGAKVLTTGGDGTTTTFDGVINSSNIALTKEGIGAFTLSNTHTFAGALTINGGTLEFTGTNGGDSVYGSTQININGASTLKVSGTAFNVRMFNGKNYTFNSVGGGKIELGAGGNYDAGVANQPFSITTQGGAQNRIKIVDVTPGNEGASGPNGINLGPGATVATFDIALGSDATSDLVVTPIVSNNGSIMKTGNGRLTLAGANTYKGTTTVSNGTLIVNGNQSAATGAVTVAGGATLAGSGTLGGNTTISGIHSPGTSPGIQSFSSDLGYTTGSSVTWELVADAIGTRGSGFDGINVGGTLDFAGSTTLNLMFNFAGSTVDWADTFWDSSHTGTSGWLVYDVAGSTNNFSNLSVTTANWSDGSGGLFNTFNSGNTFSLFKDGNDIYLNYNVVPEPRAALLGALGLLCLLRRRRP